MGALHQLQSPPARLPPPHVQHCEAALGPPRYRPPHRYRRQASGDHRLPLPREAMALHPSREPPPARNAVLPHSASISAASSPPLPGFSLQQTAGLPDRPLHTPAPSSSGQAVSVARPMWKLRQGRSAPDIPRETSGCKTAGASGQQGSHRWPGCLRPAPKGPNSWRRPRGFV